MKKKRSKHFPFTPEQWKKSVNYLKWYRDWWEVAEFKFPGDEAEQRRFMGTAIMVVESYLEQVGPDAPRRTNA